MGKALGRPMGNLVWIMGTSSILSVHGNVPSLQIVDCGQVCRIQPLICNRQNPVAHWRFSSPVANGHEFPLLVCSIHHFYFHVLQQMYRSCPFQLGLLGWHAWLQLSCQKSSSCSYTLIKNRSIYSWRTSPCPSYFNSQNLLIDLLHSASGALIKAHSVLSMKLAQGDEASSILGEGHLACKIKACCLKGACMQASWCQELEEMSMHLLCHGQNKSHHQPLEWYSACPGLFSQI